MVARSSLTHRDSRLPSRYGRYPVHSTADDISATAGDGEDIAPIVVLVAIGERAFVRAFQVSGELVLGRRIGEFELDDHRVSREHAAVRFEHGAWSSRIADRTTGPSSTARASPVRFAAAAIAWFASGTRCSCSSAMAVVTCRCRATMPTR